MFDPGMLAPSIHRLNPVSLQFLCRSVSLIVKNVVGGDVGHPESGMLATERTEKMETGILDSGFWATSHFTCGYAQRSSWLAWLTEKAGHRDAIPVVGPMQTWLEAKA
ncbi:MAG: hypothetical protein ACLQVD_20335 [Capsulimonadaceae bacterium]